MIEPNVILVDKDDYTLGVMPKMQAHVDGVLHRAISVFLFDNAGNWILQQRAYKKYHSAGLWSNTCCSHPNPGESSIEASHRRLLEEMGLDVELNYGFKFLYKAELENGLIENELDHIYFGFTNQVPLPDVNEVNSWKVMPFFQLEKDIEENPENYTKWFKLLYKKVNLHLFLETNHKKK